MSGGLFNYVGAYLGILVFNSHFPWGVDTSMDTFFGLELEMFL